MNFKIHYTSTPGYTQLVTPQISPVKELNFAMLRLEAGERYQGESASYEIGLLILTGYCAVEVTGERFENLGGRSSVFEQRATGVYIPCRSAFAIEAGAGGVEVAFCRCLSDTQYPVQLIRPEDVVAREVGGPGFKRYVHDIFGLQMEAERLIVGETFTLAGNWSSFPPHKHDVEALPNEVRQEELYLYKVRPINGFGLQYMYTQPGSPYGELDEALVVRHNDLTIIPYGYHPVAAPPGYDVYYLWFLSGPKRFMHPNDDPAHAWIKTAPEGQRTYP
jgi:5-deoxy-glucuronate isomerase